MTERKRLDLGNSNPIYEKELIKLDVHQVKGRWNVSRTGKEAKDVGISNCSMARCTSPLSRARDWFYSPLPVVTRVSIPFVPY